MKATSTLFLASLLTAGLTGATCAQQPLSAIDWLNDPFSVPVANPLTPLDEDPVADGVILPDVSVMTLDDTRRDAVGLLPSSVSGLPSSLWTASTQSRVQTLWMRTSSDPIPAVQALYYTLLLAEADPPQGDDGRFLKTRITTLRKFGAVEPARALLERAGPQTPLLFPQWLDLTLLTGDEGDACTVLRNQPELFENYAARIFCHARNGDWQTAVLLYGNARAVGLMSRTETRLLAQYLAPEDLDDAIALAPPADPSPLVFRLYEAAGAPLPTRNLPLEFSVADLRNTSGWKAEIEAAERLTRTGALSENRLLGLYTDRRPAASGGIWDRVSAVQAFDNALTAADTDAIARTLPKAWKMIQAVHLEVVFARIYGDSLRRRSVPASIAPLAFEITLLSQDYEAAARNAPPGRKPALLASIARGTPGETLAATRLERHITRALAADPIAAPRHATALRAGKLGEAILSAALLLDRAGPEDFDAITDALMTLRSVGLEDTARRAALQLLILNPRR